MFLNQRETGRRQAQAGVEECMQMECGDCEMYKPHKLLSVCMQCFIYLCYHFWKTRFRGTRHQLTPLLSMRISLFELILSYIVVHSCMVLPKAKAPDSLEEPKTHFQTFRTCFCCLKGEPLSSCFCTLATPLDNTACSYCSPASVMQASSLFSPLSH